MVEIKYDKAWFIQSREGNIKEQYFFEKKLGSGGYGAVYLAKNKQTGKYKAHTGWLQQSPLNGIKIISDDELLYG